MTLSELKEPILASDCYSAKIMDLAKNVEWHITIDNDDLKVPLPKVLLLVWIVSLQKKITVLYDHSQHSDTNFFA